MRVILLAAGYATRLYPLTRDQAKPLLDIGGRPLLDHLLDRVLELEALQDITLVTNHRFADDFEHWARTRACPVALRVIDDGTTTAEDRLGAIGDIAFALQALDPAPDDSWLVAAGDNLIELDLARVKREFDALPAPRIIVREVEPTPGPNRYNDVELASDARVIGFREKPDQTLGTHAAIAIYFFTAELPQQIARYLAAGGNRDAPGHFLQWLCARERVYASPLSGRWFDIGSHETLAAARAQFGTRKPSRDRATRDR